MVSGQKVFYGYLEVTVRASEATIWRDDSYCETVAQFKDALRSGATPTDAAKSVWAECCSAPDCDIVALALADSLWHFSALDEAMAAELLHHDYEDKIRRYLIELETSPRTIRTYLASVQSILRQFERPALPQETWTTALRRVSLTKGDCFWYVSGRTTYGAVVLECQAEVYFLIALTEAMTQSPKRPEDILNSAIYTIAWFSDTTLLPERRMHFISNVTISKSFQNQYGLQISEKSTCLTNFGQSQTWQHRFRALALRDTIIGSVVG